MFALAISIELPCLEVLWLFLVGLGIVGVVGGICVIVFLKCRVALGRFLSAFDNLAWFVFC